MFGTQSNAVKFESHNLLAIALTRPAVHKHGVTVNNDVSTHVVRCLKLHGNQFNRIATVSAIGPDLAAVVKDMANHTVRDA
jgi:hypothetical protein